MPIKFSGTSCHSRDVSFGAVRDTHADIVKFFFGAMEAAKPLARKTHAAAITFYRVSFDFNGHLSWAVAHASEGKSQPCCFGVLVALGCVAIGPVCIDC